MLQHPLLPFSVDTIAEFIYTTLDAAAAARGRATLAVPGGRSPGPIIERLAAMCDPFVRKNLHLFWVDERAVPQNHGDRNDGAILGAWDSGGPRPANVHPMPAHREDLEAAAEDYSTTMRNNGAGEGFDVCLLGIGEDGHFASCFPKHAGLNELGPVFSIYDSPKPPPKRLSVALPIIANSEHIIVLALGTDKGMRIKQALSSESSANPVSLLPGNKCRVFCDDDALTAATK